MSAADRLGAMTRSRISFAALVAIPGVALAVVGSTHPPHLTNDSAMHWWVMHIVALPLFPLMGLALVGLVRGRRDPTAWTIRVLAYVFAAFYTALDVLAGIGAGYVLDQAGPTPDASSLDAVHALFRMANDLSQYGVWALLVACVLVAADHMRSCGLMAAAPGLLLIAASYSFLDSHIYRWRGVVTVLVIGLATGWLAMVRTRREAAKPPSV